MRTTRFSACVLLFVASGWLPAEPLARDKSAFSPPASFRVDVIGRGRPMILIPGLSSSGETWKSTVARSQNRFQCHVLTLAGFAGVPPIAEPLLPKVRQELAAYIRSERLDRPVIVGHSLGGTLALALAADHPSLVGALVIVDTVPFIAGAQFQAKTLEEAKPNIAAMEAYFAAITQKQYDDYVSAGTATMWMVTKPADLEKLKEWGMQSDRRTVADALVELTKMDLRPDLQRITSPTLLLGTWIGLKAQMEKFGRTMERVEFIKTFQEQYATLARLHFAMSDNARHFVMLDDPAWFFEKLDAFLADPDRAVRTRGFSDGK